MRKVLVTGASGFIGSTLCDMLLQKQDIEVWAGIRQTSSKKYLQDTRLSFIDLDYNNPNHLKEQLQEQDFDTIFHLAGLTKAKSQKEFDKVNFTYTKNIVDALEELDCKLIYMSSFAAHGPAGENPFTQAKVSDEVQKLIWNKMFTNVSASALTAVLQMPLGYISFDEATWELCSKLVREAVDVAKALGMDFDYEEKLAEVKKVCDNAPKGLTSIYSDIKNGRRSEVDTISGSVVAAGKKVGVPTPTHDAVVAIIHALEGRPLYDKDKE